MSPPRVGCRPGRGTSRRIGMPDLPLVPRGREAYADERGRRGGRRRRHAGGDVGSAREVGPWPRGARRRADAVTGGPGWSFWPARPGLRPVPGPSSRSTGRRSRVKPGARPAGWGGARPGGRRPVRQSRAAKRLRSSASPPSASGSSPSPPARSAPRRPGGRIGFGPGTHPGKLVVDLHLSDRAASRASRAGSQGRRDKYVTTPSIMESSGDSLNRDREAV